MIKKKSIYKCEVCGNVVESLWNGNPAIVCCNKPMTELNGDREDGATEKHIPVIERDGNKVTVKVGEVPHPMAPEHYILCVEVLAGDRVYRQDFVEGTTVAEATFLVEETDVSARAYCNLHGLWNSK